MALSISADLAFVLERPGLKAVRGQLRGEANTLVLEIDDPGAFAGSKDVSGVRSFAEALAARGVVVHVEHDHRRLVSIGAVSAPWWQRRATGSRRIRVASLLGAWISARARSRRSEPVLPDASMLPPDTLWPLTPAFRRRPRRPTTTHDPLHGGNARLVLAKSDTWAGEQQLSFRLHDGITIGSRADCGIKLSGLAEVHAVVSHDEDDEWVVEAVGGKTDVHGIAITRQLLRTGARVDVGEHHLVFRRDEFADHGRPYGGRMGGELSHQRPQPPRPGLNL